jgi:hypothetical protein
MALWSSKMALSGTQMTPSGSMMARVIKSTLAGSQITLSGIQINYLIRLSDDPSEPRMALPCSQMAHPALRWTCYALRGSYHRVLDGSRSYAKFAHQNLRWPYHTMATLSDRPTKLSNELMGLSECHMRLSEGHIRLSKGPTMLSNGPTI